MKALLALALCLTLARSADITLLWDYPTNELGTDLTFKVYSSADVAAPLTNWQVSTMIGTTTAARVTMTPSKRFFFVTASNFWGESEASNTNWTPKPVTNTANLKITRP